MGAFSVFEIVQMTENSVRLAPSNGTGGGATNIEKNKLHSITSIQSLIFGLPCFYL